MRLLTTKSRVLGQIKAFSIIIWLFYFILRDLKWSRELPMLMPMPNCLCSPMLIAGPVEHMAGTYFWARWLKLRSIKSRSFWGIQNKLNANSLAAIRPPTASPLLSCSHRPQWPHERVNWGVTGCSANFLKNQIRKKTAENQHIKDGKWGWAPGKKKQ